MLRQKHGLIWVGGKKDKFMVGFLHVFRRNIEDKIKGSVNRGEPCRCRLPVGTGPVWYLPPVPYCLH